MSFEAPSFNNNPQESGPKPEKEPSRKFGLAEAGEKLNLKPQEVHRLVTEGKLKCTQRGEKGRMLFPKDEIEKFLKQKQIEKRASESEKKEPVPSIDKPSPEKISELEKRRKEAETQGTNELRHKLNKELVDAYKALWGDLSVEELDKLRDELNEEAKKGEQGAILSMKENAIAELKFGRGS